MPSITYKDVAKTYSGKPGCMCGCLGDYNESDRAKKAALTRMLKQDYTIGLWSGDKEYIGAMFYETPTRNNVLYLRKGTVLSEDMLGRVE